MTDYNETLNEQFKTEPFAATIQGKKIDTTLGLPTIAQLSDALQHEDLAEIVHGFAGYGFKSFLRNSLQAGRGTFNNFAELLAIKKLADEAKGGNTEALALRQAFIKAFDAYLVASNMKARGVKLLLGLVKSPQALGTAQSQMVERLATELDGFAATEAAADYQSILDKMADNISEASKSDAEDDLF